MGVFESVPVEYRDIVVVDDNDNKIGLMNILQAHKGGGVMHRAISVILVNKKGEVLLQKRSSKKPLWPMFWSNTVCTHPVDGEEYVECAVRRLKEEMGIEIENSDPPKAGAIRRAGRGLRVVGKLKYQAQYNDELSEFELDTVVVGRYEGKVEANPEEVAEYRWVGVEELGDEIEREPDKFTPWFRLILSNKKFADAIEEEIEK